MTGRGSVPPLSVALPPSGRDGVPPLSVALPPSGSGGVPPLSVSMLSVALPPSGSGGVPPLSDSMLSVALPPSGSGGVPPLSVSLPPSGSGGVPPLSVSMLSVALPPSGSGGVPPLSVSMLSVQLPSRRPLVTSSAGRRLDEYTLRLRMLIAKHLRHDRIRLEMETEPLTAEELEEFGPRATRELQERVFREIAEFLDATARVGNATRLRKDLFEREKKAPTAMGGGLAMPHVRTMNVKEPTIAFLRSTPGLDFGAPDDSPVHVFLVLVAPPWDDRLYLKIYREAGTIFLRDDTLPSLLAAAHANDVFNFFRACDYAVED